MLDWPHLPSHLPTMPVFTAATARKAALRSVEARRMQAARREARALMAPDLAAPLDTAGPVPPPPANGTSYAERRLHCVRLQLARVDAMLMTEQDPQRLDRLASAQLRLSEQERVLAGRPLPGQRRPGPERAVNPMAWLQSATNGHREDASEAPEPAPEPLEAPASPPEPGEGGAVSTPEPGQPAPMAPAPGQPGGRAAMALSLARNLFP